MSLEEREALIAELTTRVGELIIATKIPEAVQTEVKKAHQRQRIYNIWLGISLVVDLALSAIFGVGIYLLGELQDTTTTTSCDLYSLLVGSINNPQPEQIDTPEKREAYEAAVKVVFDNYKALGCDDR